MRHLLTVLFLSARLISAEVNLVPLGTSIDFLDCPCTFSNNSLKGIEIFTVLVTAPEGTGLFVGELEKIGTVKKISLSDPKGINFEGMGTGARLLFIITPLQEEGDAFKQQLTRVTLCLSMTVEILKTKNRIDSYVWATNQFVTKDKVNDAIKTVVNQFATYQKNANPHTNPLFYVYQ